MREKKKKKKVEFGIESNGRKYISTSALANIIVTIFLNKSSIV